MKILRLDTKDKVKILQLTDLHLMNNDADDLTYQLIKNMVAHVTPDFIVITGDMFMSNSSLLLAHTLYHFIDHFQIPWTFVFGNHDEEGHSTKEELANVLSQSKYIVYENEENLPGVGNHLIELRLAEEIRYRLIMLDSHNARIDNVNGIDIWSYDYIKPEQVEFVKTWIRDVNSLLFFHIPLPEFADFSKEQITGEQNETICSSKYNSGLFDECVISNHVLGIFCGHDHVNDYSFKKQGITLAYGRCSGHYNYTLPAFKKGARVIELSTTGDLHTYTLVE